MKHTPKMMDSSVSESNLNHVDEEEKEGTFIYAMQLAMGTVLPMVIQATFELFKAGPDAKLSASEIAAKMSTKNPDAPMMLDRLLRLLASHQVLNCSCNGLERLYSLSPVSRYYVPNQNGVSLGPYMAMIQDNVFLQSWSQLKNAVLEGGIPFNRMHGTHVFNYPGLDPRFNKVLNTAMFNHTTTVIEKILESYKGFEGLNQLVDVGGGFGQTLKEITSKYPHIKGINFDLPHVIQHAPNYPGVEHEGGDMFESIPQGDAIFMKWILHDWSDDDCLRLLKNCYKAIPDDGKVIVVEAVVPTRVSTTSASEKLTSQMDVFMMTQCPGGKERMEHEFMALATAAGFGGIRYDCFVCNFWVMEIFK